jgi:hypothetical protein
MPAYAHALPFIPCCDIVADCLDATGDFMTWHTGILKPGPETFFDQNVTVANAARIYFHPDLPGRRLRDITLH